MALDAAVALEPCAALTHCSPFKKHGSGEQREGYAKGARNVKHKNKMRDALRTLLLAFVCACAQSRRQLKTSEYQSQLYQDLFWAYLRDPLPVEELDKPLLIQFGASLIRIIEVVNESSERCSENCSHRTRRTKCLPLIYGSKCAGSTRVFSGIQRITAMSSGFTCHRMRFGYPTSSCTTSALRSL